MSERLPLLVGFFLGALAGTGATLMLTGSDTDKVEKQVVQPGFLPEGGIEAKAATSAPVSASESVSVSMTPEQRLRLRETQQRQLADPDFRQRQVQPVDRAVRQFPEDPRTVFLDQASQL